MPSRKNPEMYHTFWAGYCEKTRLEYIKLMSFPLIEDNNINKNVEYIETSYFQDIKKAFYYDIERMGFLNTIQIQVRGLKNEPLMFQILNVVSFFNTIVVYFQNFLCERNAYIKDRDMNMLAYESTYGKYIAARWGGSLKFKMMSWNEKQERFVIKSMKCSNIEQNDTFVDSNFFEEQFGMSSTIKYTKQLSL